MQKGIHIRHMYALEYSRFCAAIYLVTEYDSGYLPASYPMLPASHSIYARSIHDLFHIHAMYS